MRHVRSNPVDCSWISRRLKGYSDVVIAMPAMLSNRKGEGRLDSRTHSRRGSMLMLNRAELA